MAQSEIRMKMSLDGSGVKKTLNRTKASIKNWSKSGVASIARFGAAFAGIGLVKSIIGLGVSAAETADKFNAVFGKAAVEMNKRILELKKTIPATTKEMQDALSTFGAMAQAMGFNSEATQEFSINMVKIAGDLASFHEMKPDEVFLKMRAAITGEFEPLKSMGIMLNEAKVKQEALNLGIWDGVGALSSSQKAMAVQSLVVAQMGAASGNAALTVNSAANQIKFLQARLKDTGTEIGTTILPAIADLTQAMSTLLTWSKKAAEGVGEAFGNVLSGNTDKDPLAGFREAAATKLAKEGKLSTVGGSGGVAQRKKQIEAEAAILKASYDERIAKQKELNGLKAEESETGAEISEEQKEINRLNEELAQSIRDQIAAQGKFKSQQEQTVSTSKAKADIPEKMGLNIERGEFEGRKDFLLRREKARTANIKLNEVRQQVAAGAKTPDMATIQSLIAEAGGGKKDIATQTLTAAQESKELLKNINKGING